MTKKVMAEIIKELENDLLEKTLRLNALERELESWRAKNSSKATSSK